MLAFVVGNGLTSAVVLVIGVVSSGVPGAWKMLSVPCLLSNGLLDRDLWGQSLCVLISTHSQEGQIVLQDFDRRIVFSSDIIVNHHRDFGPLGRTLLRTVIFPRHTCVSSHNYVSVFNS